ncbi:TIR domain-containing protein [Parafrankia sp. EUN1f]|uniref:TIR domain-containing protein n=1 Tax=Parafrankia sp. EUN1f TaxID=102897 RepID=UPI0001C4471B|nr:TIR domain-containing protein [Parafrankia sp. EUN1f]EFC83751.1 YheO domain protein [Parafrankia sp. EUN1f]
MDGAWSRNGDGSQHPAGGARGEGETGEAEWAEYDFFVSYHATDRRWASWVAWILEDAGYRVVLQAWDFTPGMRWASFLEKAVRSSERVICLLSDAYLAWAYAKQQWEDAYVADPDGFERKLLPIRVADCSRPGMLNKIQAFDLFGLADEREARDILLQEVRNALSGRAKPATKPPFPGARATDPEQPAWTSTPASKPGASLLPGEPLATMPNYPVILRDGRRIELDLERLRQACAEVIEAGNIRAAVDLVYLADQNYHTIETSPDTKAHVVEVKKKFQAELLQLDVSHVQRKNLIVPLENMTEGLGAMFADLPIEFVLHDTRDPLHSVCAIRNPITGRRKGSPASNIALEQIRGKGRSLPPVYKVRLPDGSLLKCSTISFRHRVFGLIALLCVNIDIERFQPQAPGVASLLEALTRVSGELVDETFFD